MQPEPGVCSKSHQSLLVLPPSIWCAAVAVPHVKPAGNARPGPFPAIGASSPLVLGYRAARYRSLTMTSHSSPMTDAPDSQREGTGAPGGTVPAPMVEAHGLVKRFGDFVAVNGVDFSIAKGESFGFLGPNGAGKTSTMRMISCISPLSGGTLRVLGMDPAKDGPRIRSRMGLVPQEDSLDLELTVLDNLMIYGRYFDMPKKVIRERAEQLLDFAQLTERAHDRVDPLSGGMKRRLTIARALISDPDLLILDEPTTGLDPQARHLLWDRLYRLKQDGVTLVITTHYMDEAEQLCDRLVVMDKGGFAAEGTPRQLIRGVLDQRGRRAPLRARPARGGRAVAGAVGGAPGGAARPHPPLHRRRRRRAGRGRPHGARGPGHARAPVDARGRVPAPHRALPGGLIR